MMAQKLMSENKDNPFNSRFFQPSDAMAAPQSQGFRNLMSRMETRDKQGTGANLYAGGAIASGFTPGAGVSDVLGYAPDPFNPGQTLPSFSENIDQGKYLDAGLQTVGAGGDVMLAASPFMPLLLAPAAAMKMTSQIGKALRSGSKATKSLDNAGEVAKVVPPTDKSDGIFAFHGSGADFDEFSLRKIGTGEGNQAFGYGLYFTDSKDIAKFYKKTTSKDYGDLTTKFMDQKIGDKSFGEYDIEIRKEIVDFVKNDDKQGLIKFSKERKKRWESLSKDKSYPYNDYAKDKVKAFNEFINDLGTDKKLVSTLGKTYEVNIKTVIDDLIDYDKSFKQQNDKIKKILKPYYKYYGVAETADFGTLLESTYRHLPQDEFSERLAKEGIKGIKYQSGQLSGITDSKATNYVIFDDKIIDIMAKYGIVGAIGVSAMQGASGGTEGDILPPGNT